jgi:tetratricopeptide (TPR) repeat protein
MTSQTWNAAKSLYFEACSASVGPEPFLREHSHVDEEVLALVRELLAEQPDLLPDLHRPCWSPDTQDSSRRALEAGRILLDRFEIVGFLGAGGLGEVYRAFDHRQMKFVALKTLRPRLAANPSALTMLRNELNTARSVTNPNVCRLHDIHWSLASETPPFFTMDLLEGVTLAQHIRSHGPFHPAAALPLALQMIAGLAAVHASNIVHRDFKSGNVMLTENGRRAVIMDFGLAREIVPGATLETTLASISFAGTPAYMAPEQLRGNKATFASDIHGMGVVLFEMVTGRLPFGGDGALEIASRRLNEEAPPPREFAPKLDRRWDYTILRCLAADPKSRPFSVEAVGELLISKPPVLWGRRRFVTGVAATAAASAAAGAGVFWTTIKQRSPIGVEIFDIDNKTGNASLDYVARGTTTELIRRFSAIRNLSVMPMRVVRAGGSVAGKGRFSLSGALSTGGKSGVQLDIRLEDTHGEGPVWSRIFEKDQFGGLLPLQEEISKQAAAELQRVIANSQGAALAALEDWLPGWSSVGGSPTRNTSAFDLYMRGSSLLQESTPESLHAAVGFFERAVAEDPHFALAFASLSQAHLSLLNFGFDYNATLAGAAREFALKAVREDPSLAEGHAAMGAVYQRDWDWLASESEYNRALELKPKFPRALRWRAGLVLQFARFDEAIAAFEEAYRQDPYDRSAISGYGVTLMFAGKVREAVELMERETGDRDMATARNNLGHALGYLARRANGGEAADLYRRAFEQARIVESIEKRTGAVRSAQSTVLHALLHSFRGDYEAAAPYLESLEREVSARTTSPFPLAEVYVAQHRLDMAQIALDQTFLLRGNLIYLRVDIFLEELRGQPRFEAMLRTMHLK